MALAGRSARRRGTGARWLAAAVVATLLILLIDAALHSRSEGPVEQLKAGQWVDHVLPVITTSNQEGQQLASLWSSAASTTDSEVTSELATISAGAATAYTDVTKVGPPADLSGSADLLEACLLARSDGAKQLQETVDAALAAPSGSDPSLSGIQTAAADLSTADQDYQLFERNLPNIGVSMPSSVWVDSASSYTPTSVQVFLTTLQNDTSASPVNELKIYSVTTSPAAVTMNGGVDVLPDSSTVEVTAVVADVGNQQDNNLTITASISPSKSGASSVRDFASLSPGQATTIESMGPLYPPEGSDVTLTVTVTPPAGSTTAPASDTLVLSMPAPPPTTTTTSTTVAGG